MKRFFLLFTVIALSAGLFGCRKTNTPAPTEQTQVTTQATEPATEATEPATQATEPATEATEPPTMETVRPEHSPLYIPGVCVEDVITYFNEVCLDAEIVNSGNPEVLQKWETTIRYSINGEPTEEDMEKLNGFVDWLNMQEGFPGIRPAGGAEAANMRIHFCDAQGLLDRMGSEMTGLDGATTFWYRENRIYDAIICYRTDIPQYTRNSVILEEIYNALGPMQDTSLRENSIIYSGFSEPQVLTQIDQLILQLLYHPQMLCGMNAAECEAVIRELYY